MTTVWQIQPICKGGMQRSMVMCGMAAAVLRRAAWNLHWHALGGRQAHQEHYKACVCGGLCMCPASKMAPLTPTTVTLSTINQCCTVVRGLCHSHCSDYAVLHSNIM
jgi:hypothetical protein